MPRGLNVKFLAACYNRPFTLTLGRKKYPNYIGNLPNKFLGCSGTYVQLLLKALLNNNSARFGLKPQETLKSLDCALFEQSTKIFCAARQAEHSAITEEKVLKLEL